VPVNEWAEEDHPCELTALASFGKLLYVGYANGLFRQFELTTAESSFEYPGHEGAVNHWTKSRAESRLADKQPANHRQ